jgi:hypothetical protein
MRKAIFLNILVYLFPYVGHSQKPNRDTAYYSPGVLKYIKYNIGERYSSEIKYFKNSKNSLDKNLPILDTVYNNDFAGKDRWTHYDGSTRIYLHKRSNIWIGKITKYGSNKDSAYLKINGLYHYLFRELGDLQLTLGYENDSGITYLSIQTYDTIRKGNSHKELFIINRYSSESVKFNPGEGNYIYNCGDLGVMELIFSNNNLLKNMTFYPKNKNQNAITYEFCDTFFCNKYYNSINKILCGEFYEYHQNGNLKSIGCYELYKESGHLSSRKTGLWQYFKSDGELLSKEKWQDGNKTDIVK